MHVVIFADQAPHSLGGAQVSIRLQCEYLLRRGYQVTLVAPAPARTAGVTDRKPPRAFDHAGYTEIALPSRAITADREYTASWPGARCDRLIAAVLQQLPSVDVVHIQGDFWGAIAGVRTARALSRSSGTRVPVVYTIHNHLEAGTRAVTRLAAGVFVALRLWRRMMLGASQTRPARRARGSWKYLGLLAAECDVVTAPSQHFATLLEQHGVAERVRVTPNGVNDEYIQRLRTRPRSSRTRPQLVWLGRMSQEKRVLEFLDAIVRADIDADVTLIGAGMLLTQVQQKIQSAQIADRVRILAPMPHFEALAHIADADVLVQTSVSFETQGMTPFEAAALGTPVLFCDPVIADDVAATPEWRVENASVDALAVSLKQAVRDCRAATPDGVALRVSEHVSQRFVQSSRSAEMIEVYRQACHSVQQEWA